MNSKIERMEKLLIVAFETNNQELERALTTSIIQEWSLEISRVLQPMNGFRLPFAVATLEIYAKALKEKIPEANDAIENLKSIPMTCITITGERDHNE